VIASHTLEGENDKAKAGKS